jgi:hypothetical protein
VQLLLKLDASDKKEAFDNLIRAGESFTVALHGTKMKWAALANSDLSIISRKDAAYAPEDYSMSVAAEQILNAIAG